MTAKHAAVISNMYFNTYYFMYTKLQYFCIHLK